ncbi:MAG: FAD-dependent oxidoreductase, partial [Lentisphaerae bacterium]|nr:FAD-dependent oxidoreductase [Lentisphaerota bacterium]
LGYWWVELGGEDDSIRDTERLRDELLRIVLGIWDHIKNRCAHKNDAENWAMDWLQFLPAKRESRRYVGDHLLTQGDIEAEGRFDDTVAYGGWTMDDHDPAGFRACRDGRPATHWHTAPSPYGIPYRMLYSKNIENLMFAGRCASATHMAMSSTRVMGTGCVMGQAVGTAAAMAVKRGVLPKDAHGFMRELQQALLRDDCYLPGLIQEVSPLTGTAELTASQGDPEPMRDGVHRPVGQALHGWTCGPGDHASYRFAKPERVHGVILTLDSAMDRLIAMSWFGNYKPLTAPPSVMLKDFRLEGLRDGRWTALTNVKGNYQRCVRVALEGELEGIRLVPEATWGAAHTTIFRFELV